MVEGVGVGATTTAGLAAAADLSTPLTRGRMLSWYQSAQLLGFWFGPLIGGLVACVRIAWPLVYAVIAAVAILPALLVRDTANAARHTGSHRAAFGALFRNRDFLLIALVSFVVFFTMTGALMTAMPLFAAHDMNAGPEFVGVALFLSSTVGFLLLYPSGLISDRRGRRGIIVALLAVAALALLLLAVATSGPIVLLAVLGLGAGNVLRGPATAAYVMDAGRHAGTARRLARFVLWVISGQRWGDRRQPHLRPELPDLLRRQCGYRGRGWPHLLALRECESRQAHSEGSHRLRR